MKAKKLLALGIAGVITLSALLSGCGKSGTDASKNEPTAVPTQEPPQKYTIELMSSGSTSNLPTPDKDFVKQTIDKALNIDLQLNFVASAEDYKNKLNVRLASGNAPDILNPSGRANTAEYGKNGLLLDLKPYESKLKDTKTFIGDAVWKAGNINGKQFSIPQAPKFNYATYWVRKDWMNAVGITALPKTTEELFQLAKAFVEKDPDGNGKKDTIGITGTKGGGYLPIYASYGTAAGWQVYVKDGKLASSFMRDEKNFKDAVAEINRFESAGIFDPEHMLNSDDQTTQKAFQGKAGIVYLNWANIAKKEFIDKYKAINPKAEWAQIPALKGPGGEFVTRFDENEVATYSLPASLAKDEKKLQRVIDLINYVSAEEGNLLVQFGMKGTHFNIVDKKVVPTELMAKESGYTWLYQITGRPEMTYLQTKFPEAAKEIEFASKAPVIKCYNSLVDKPDSYVQADLEKYYNEEIIKFYYSKRPLAELDKFIETVNTTYKFKQYFDAAETQLKALGIAK